MDEITAFVPVLEDVDILVIQKQRGEDGKNARIGILQRLSRTIDVLETENRIVDIHGRAHRLNHRLLCQLGERIQGIRRRPTIFRSRQERKLGIARIAMHREIAPNHIVRMTSARIHHTAVRTTIFPFAIHRS